MRIGATVSLALNALLPGFVLWLACAGPNPKLRSGVSQFLTHCMRPLKRLPAPPPSGSAPWPEVIEAGEPFHWAQLESADYRVYLANLRRIGCPETTVRDIIIADVNELFAARVKALVDEVSGQFWHLLTREDDSKTLMEEKQKQLSALDDERDAVFAALFGNSNPRADEAEHAAAEDRREHWERLADFLPAEKRAQLAAAKAELEGSLRDVYRTPGLTGAQQQAKRKELEAAHDQALHAWLTPDEYDELSLRQSSAASLRDRLLDLDLSEDKVRAVVRIQFAKEQAQAALSQQEPGFKSRLAELQQQSEAHTRELLGTDTYAALLRATDGRYEPISRVTQRLELPETTAAQAYEVRRQAEDAARQLRDNQSLTAEDRQAMLQALCAQTKQNLSDTLGPKGLAAYETIDGGWMQHLNAPVP
jgi:hypothetical protein